MCVYMYMCVCVCAFFCVCVCVCVHACIEVSTRVGVCMGNLPGKCFRSGCDGMLYLKDRNSSGRPEPVQA